jgi:ribosomal protein S6
MKQVSHKIVDNGGIVRSIQNHGIREFPHRYMSKYADFTTGQRYYDKGRYISVYYDANPKTLAQVEKILSMNDQVLRMVHLKARSKLDFVTIQRQDRNPYIQTIERMDEKKRQNNEAEEMAIATALDEDHLVETLMDSLKED